MPRAVQIRTLFLVLLLLLTVIGCGGWIWSALNAQKDRAERDDLLAQRYLLECARALETTRDNVTEKIAPLEGKSCDDPLLSGPGLKVPGAADSEVNSSKITVNRALEPYSPGEYTVTVFSSGGKVWSIARGGKMGVVGSS